jgi:eukaryotic-like serine/threonine-protein kinase
MPDSPLPVAPEFIALQQAVIGRYSLERELGRGGMGIVFLARDVALDRLVAIKLLPPALASRAELRERFLREAQTAAKLSQPNIVPIHAVEETGGLVFFVMSYIEGETLGERLRAKGALTPHEAARVVREVAWALGYAHGRGVVHRDVKPDNIMLERGTGRAVVMDFGIAALAAEARGGEVLGTAQYISPEQANGDPVDGRSDLYSLGVVAFLMLTGRLPFHAEDLPGMLAMHVTRPAPPVGSVTPGLPRRFAQAVDRCLAKNPADRFPDGEALAECVAQAIEPPRQVPVPVRLWLTKNAQEIRLLYGLWYSAGGIGMGFAVANIFARPFLGPAAAAVAGFATWLLPPLVMHVSSRIWRLRKLLEQGYTIEDVRLATRDAAERRREELAYEYAAEPPLWARIDRGLMFLSGATFVTTILGLITGIIRPYNEASAMTLVWFVFGGAATWFGTAVLQTMVPGKRVTRDLVAEWRVRFWNSRPARWFEKIARVLLKRRAAPAELTYRPTELAIGIAADALFETLPKEQRKELKELPLLLERLQRDAQLMRRTVDDLNGALSGLGEATPAQQSSALRQDRSAADTLAQTREKLRADLAVRRDDAARRLGAAVAALENIRLNLLRLKAGTGSVAELTADLTAARAAQQDLAIAAAAREEVEELLRTTMSTSGKLRMSEATPA